MLIRLKVKAQATTGGTRHVPICLTVKAQCDNNIFGHSACPNLPIGKGIGFTRRKSGGTRLVRIRLAVKAQCVKMQKTVLLGLF